MAKRVIVIGAGLGGIAAAGRLARRGFEVTVVERMDCAGGRCGKLEHEGFVFDTGPTLFLMPEIFHQTFTDFGVKLEDHLGLVRQDPTYRVHFNDGSSIDLTSDMIRMREQLESIEKGAFSRFLRFMAYGREFYDLSLKHFVGRNFCRALDYFSPANLGLVFRMKALTSHHRFTSRFFQDDRLRAAFSFQNMYLGLSPYHAPATYALLQYSELGDGVWFPRGGMYRLIESLVGVVRSLGVRFEFGTAVERIELDGTAAKGVVLENGERLAADIVLANADLPYVYDRLLPKDGTHEKLARKRYSSSTLMFYWGVRGEPPQALLHHNCFLADHCYRESFDRIFEDLTLPDVPSFYVNMASLTEPDFAPTGHHGLMVLVPVGHLNGTRPQDWPALRDKARNAVLKGLSRIGVDGLPSNILFEKTLGPPEYERDFNLANGAAFGLSHNFMQVGYLRPHNRHRRFGNLYFVGASTHPGTGLPMVLLSARLVVERILQEHGAPGAASIAKKENV